MADRFGAFLPTPEPAEAAPAAAGAHGGAKAKKKKRKRKAAAISDDVDAMADETRQARERERQRLEATGSVSGVELSEDGRLQLTGGSSLEGAVFLCEELSRRLKAHQIEGVRFLFGHIASGEGHGCVLADYMGLGKTIQVISVLQAFMGACARDVEEGEDEPEEGRVRALVVAPAICVRNWYAECQKWLRPETMADVNPIVLDSGTARNLEERIEILRQWHTSGGVLLIGYELFRQLALNKDSHVLHAALCDPGPEVVVLDEGHRVRSHKSQTFKALVQLRTPRRVVLTGYPMQNHLSEYYTMVNFCRPNFLGTRDEFKSRFEVPILAGQAKDADDGAVKLARRRAYVLTDELRSIVLRRDAQFLYENLPPKREWVVYCRPTPAQQALYRAFLHSRGTMHRSKDVLSAYSTLLMIVNHPDILATATGKSRDAALAAALEAERGGLGEAALMTAAGGGDEPHRLQWAEPVFNGYTPGNIEHSTKMLVLRQIMRHAAFLGERIVVFSQSIATLTAIEMMVAAENADMEANPDNHPVRRRPYRTLRIDGSTPQATRFDIISTFNDPASDVDMILVSTRAGGEGINLFGGSRLVIFDVCWNPCHDHQSMCRSHRLGQTKRVHVYRLVGAGTMEKKIYDLQLRKEGLSKRIVDDKATDRKFSTTELQGFLSLSDFDAVVNGTAGDTPPPVEAARDDEILMRMLQNRPEWVYDWVPAETMLEENLAERCPAEEEEFAKRELEVEAAVGANAIRNWTQDEMKFHIRCRDALQQGTAMPSTEATARCQLCLFVAKYPVSHQGQLLSEVCRECNQPTVQVASFTAQRVQMLARSAAYGPASTAAVGGAPQAPGPVAGPGHGHGHVAAEVFAELVCPRCFATNNPRLLPNGALVDQRCAGCGLLSLPATASPAAGARAGRPRAKQRQQPRPLFYGMRIGVLPRGVTNPERLEETLLTNGAVVVEPDDNPDIVLVGHDAAAAAPEGVTAVRFEWAAECVDKGVLVPYDEDDDDFDSEEDEDDEDEDEDDGWALNHEGTFVLADILGDAAHAHAGAAAAAASDEVETALDDLDDLLGV